MSRPWRGPPQVKINNILDLILAFLPFWLLSWYDPAADEIENFWVEGWLAKFKILINDTALKNEECEWFEENTS